MKRNLFSTILVILLACVVLSSMAVFSGCKQSTSQAPAAVVATGTAGKTIEITFAYFPPPGNCDYQGMGSMGT